MIYFRTRDQDVIDFETRVSLKIALVWVSACVSAKHSRRAQAFQVDAILRFMRCVDYVAYFRKVFHAASATILLSGSTCTWRRRVCRCSKACHHPLGNAWGSSAAATMAATTQLRLWPNKHTTNTGSLRWEAAIDFSALASALGSGMVSSRQHSDTYDAVVGRRMFVSVLRSTTKTRGAVLDAIADGRVVADPTCTKDPRELNRDWRKHAAAKANRVSAGSITKLPMIDRAPVCGSLRRQETPKSCMPLCKGHAYANTTS